MPFPLLPTWKTEVITDIKPDFLKAQGIRLVMLDFDNTIVPYTTNIPTDEVKQWLQTMLQAGLTVCVVSNSHNSRVPDFCKEYGIDCITHSNKPSRRGIRQCLARYRVPVRKAVMVGDQIFTDTLAGGRARVRTILVKSIHNHTFWLKLRHIAELPFIYAAKNRRLPS